MFLQTVERCVFGNPRSPHLRLLRRAGCATMRNDGRLNVESTLASQHWAYEQGLLDGELAAEEIWDPRFVEHAAAVLRERDAASSEPGGDDKR
jgi:hypothetical protein